MLLDAPGCGPIPGGKLDIGSEVDAGTGGELSVACANALAQATIVHRAIAIGLNSTIVF
jgi:hypothetical protein